MPAARSSSAPRRLPAALLWLLCLLLPRWSGRAAATPAMPDLANTYWRIVDLGTLTGYHGSNAVAINNANQVLAYAQDAQLPPRAFLWDQGTVTDLGSPQPDASVVPTALNDAGVAVGNVTVGDTTTAFRWEAGTMSVLPLPPGFSESEATAINGSGIVVGGAWNAQNKADEQAVVWDAEGSHPLPTIEGYPRNVAASINAGGTIAGTVYADQSVLGLPVTWTQGLIATLPPVPGYTYGEVMSINDAGAVVGRAWEPPLYHAAALWQNGAGSVIVQNGTAGHINSAGWVSLSVPAYRTSHSDFWTPATGMVYLAARSRLDSGEENLTDGSLYALNDVGAAAGSADFREEGTHATLLEPLGTTAVALGQSVDRSRVSEGETVTFRVTVTNVGEFPTLGLAAWEGMPGGLVATSATSAAGTVEFNERGAGWTPGVLSPGQSAVMAVTARAISGGYPIVVADASAFNAPWQDVQASVRVTVDGAAHPVMSGTWRYLSFDPTGPTSSRLGVFGEFLLSNLGTGDEPRARVAIYLSPTPGVPAGRTPERVLTVPAVPAGEYVEPTVSFTSGRTSSQMRYLVATVEPVGKHRPSGSTVVVVVPIPSTGS